MKHKGFEPIKKGMEGYFKRPETRATVCNFGHWNFLILRGFPEWEYVSLLFNPATKVIRCIKGDQETGYKAIPNRGKSVRITINKIVKTYKLKYPDNSTIYCNVEPNKNYFDIQLP